MFISGKHGDEIVRKPINTTLLSVTHLLQVSKFNLGNIDIDVVLYCGWDKIRGNKHLSRMKTYAARETGSQARWDRGAVEVDCFAGCDRYFSLMEAGRVNKGVKSDPSSSIAKVKREW